MKTIYSITLFFALLISSNTMAQSVTRAFSGFDHLEVSGAFDVILEKGATESVRIVPGNIDPKKIITEMKGNTLKVYQEKGNYRMEDTKVYITYKDLKQIDRSGSGNFVCTSDLTAPDFKLNISGSGDSSIKGRIKASNLLYNASGSGNSKITSIDAEDFDLNLSGSGNIEILSGKTKNQVIHLAGSGNILASDVKSEVSRIDIGGSGNVEVYASKAIEGSIAGSGNIEYKGDAEITKRSIAGSGKISKN